MVGNFFLIAFRTFYKFRFFTLINIIGLTLGITACLIIFLFVRFELSYDQFHKHASQIVRIDWDLNMGDVHTHNAAVTPPMAEALIRDYPEVITAARFRYSGAFQFKRDIENTVEGRVVYADNEIFTVFTLPFLEGDPSTALRDPFSMVITASAAKQFFPEGEALGKTLIKDNAEAYTITGVIQDLPENSHFHYRIFLSMEGLKEAKNGNWIGGPFNTYALLRPDADPKAFEAKLPMLVEKYILPYAQTSLGDSFIDNFKASGNQLTLRVMPLTDIHLYSHLRNELEGNGDIDTVYLFSVIAVFTLLIACINFMNLATARSTRRAREVGIRKVMGSTRLKLALQFMGESTILSLVSFLLAIGVTDLMLPFFNSITEMHLVIPFTDVKWISIITFSALAIGIASGFYPGIVLSSFQPAKVLKGAIVADRSARLRSGLVVFQFTISIFLIIGTMALYQQMQFMRNKKLGFNKEQVMVLRDIGNIGNRIHTIKEELVKNNLIQSGTVSSYFPGPGSARNTPLLWQYGKTPLPENSVNAEKWLVDYDYINTLGIELVAGRNFSKEYPSDSAAVLLNEAAIDQFGFRGNPVGQKISLFLQNEDGSENQSQLETREIIGVIKNFNFESLRQEIGPLGLFLGNSRNQLALRYAAYNTQEVIQLVEKKWKELAPGEPFHYTFLDQNFQRMFATEEKMGKLFTAFSGLAIVIACMGLFALTAYTAEQRTKEIGVRKVLGASVQNIILLLSKDFGKLILLGFLVATPLAAYAIRWYLQSYAFRTDINGWIYVLAGTITFILAFATMGYQSVRAARSNPVEALKSE